MVTVAYEKWSFTIGFNCGGFDWGKFWSHILGGRLRKVVAQGGKTVFILLRIRALATFFLTEEGGPVASCRGVWGYPQNCQNWRLRNAIFSTCHEICLRKIDLEYENGKPLQVTIIKITESKVSPSKDLMSRAQQDQRGGRRASAPLAPPLATALRILRVKRRGGP